MSIVLCDKCDKQIDSDYKILYEVDGAVWCEDCVEEVDGLMEVLEQN